MLFNETAYVEIADQVTRLRDARKRAANLWRDEWDDGANAIDKTCLEAASRDTPLHWRQVCDLAIKLRMEMKASGGHETVYFVESVLLTDLIEKSLGQAAASRGFRLARTLTS